MKSNGKDKACLGETDVTEMKRLISEAYNHIFRLIPEFPYQREWRGDWLNRAEKYRKK